MTRHVSTRHCSNMAAAVCALVLQLLHITVLTMIGIHLLAGQKSHATAVYKLQHQRMAEACGCGLLLAPLLMPHSRFLVERVHGLHQRSVR